MNRKRILKHLVFLMFFLFILNLIAQEFYWYFTIWYFDIIMHFLSGFWVGLFFLYVFYNENLFLKQILTVILGVLLIGVLWEAFEKKFILFCQPRGWHCRCSRTLCRYCRKIKTWGWIKFTRRRMLSWLYLSGKVLSIMKK